MWSNDSRTALSGKGPYRELAPCGEAILPRLFALGGREWPKAWPRTWRAASREEAEKLAQAIREVQSENAH